MTRRDFLQLLLALPAGASLAHYEALAAPARDQVKITDIKVMQVRDPGTLIKIETDAGISGIGPCGASGPGRARRHPRTAPGPAAAPGADRQGPARHPVHFHNMFYGYPSAAGRCAC